MAIPTLFPYQQISVNEIISKLSQPEAKSLLYQLSTGGGKTFVFSFLIKEWIKLTGKKILVLCHKDELITQTIDSLNSIGVTAEAITADVKECKHNSSVYVAMVETANRRLQKNPFFFHDVGLVICDEAHILIFDKLFKYFPKAKILGCSATPVLDKKITFFKCHWCKNEFSESSICCGMDAREWSRPYTMSEIYDDIVVGVSIKELIDMGRLVKEITFAKKYTDNENLIIGIDGDFTEDSMDKAYGTAKAVFDCVLNYEEICYGKKTMVFNPTTSTNALVYNKFIERGINARMYDSVNSKPKERKELVEWFENTPDAVLCNVGCFTTGFDVTDVEAIILNRPTNSLSLFLQMVGRGGRTTNKIYKDRFILIDGGGNVERFNEWSDDSRDWTEIFFKGVGKAKEKRGKMDVTDVQMCEGCGSLMAKSELECSVCGEEFKKKPKAVSATSDEVFEPIREIPPPDPEKIYKYTVSLQEKINFAFKIMVNQILDMFKFYRVDKLLYMQTRDNGNLKKKIHRMLDNCYYYLVAQDDLKTDRTASLTTIYSRIKQKLDSMYKIDPEDNEPINPD